MTITSLSENCSTVSFSFDSFTAYYNLKNGVAAYVPNQYDLHKDRFFHVEGFYEEPNNANSNYIITICINITTRCNLRCSYCFNDKKDKKDIGVADACQFIDRIIKMRPTANRYFVDLAGSGEPLLFLDRILEIADYCIKKQNEIKKDVVARLVTNGVLLNSKVASKLRKHNILFGISLDGYKELHDTYRLDINRKGTYDRIIANFDNIEDKSLIGVAMTYATDDVDIFRAYLELEKKFETISIRPARVDYSNVEIEKIIVGYERVKNLIIKSAVSDNDISLLKKILNGDDLFGKTILKVISNAYSEHRCDAGISRFSLGADLNVYPCSAYVFNDRAILGENLCFEHLEYHECRECYLKNFCGGMCPIQAKFTNGNEKICKLKKSLFIMALEIIGNIKFKSQKYCELVEFVNIILVRCLKDDKLILLAEKCAGIYTYTELQTIKYKDIDKFNELYCRYCNTNDICTK